MWKKAMIMASFAFLFVAPHAFAYVNIPTDANLCSKGVYIDEVSDYNTGSRLCVDTDIFKYWDNSAYNTPISYIQIATSTVTLDGRYLFLVTDIEADQSPKCPVSVQDGSGTIIGTNDSPSNSTAGEYTYKVDPFTSDHNRLYQFCRYDLGTSLPVIASGLRFSPATSTPYGPFNGTSFNENGRIFGVYTSASSTSFEDSYTPFTKWRDFQAEQNLTRTRIISFTPADGDIYSTTTVNFTLSYYISPDDIGTFDSVRITFRNIDQNKILSAVRGKDIEFISRIADTSGRFDFASSTVLEDGNYRIEAQLYKSYLSGLVNPFSDISVTQNHQFIVGTSTFLGHISQNSFTEMQSIFGSYTSTSTAGLSSSCNPISGFDTSKCLAFLFIPSGEQLNDSLNSARSAIFNKVPVGYFNRMYTIWQSTATGTLPTVNVHIPIPNETHVFTLDMGDMFRGAGQEIDSISSPINHVGVKDVFEPFVKLMVAIAVMFTIITDITGSHKHEQPNTSGSKTKYS